MAASATAWIFMRRARRASSLVEADRGAEPIGPAARGGAVPGSLLCVGRDVVLLWRSAERGVAAPIGHSSGKQPEPLRRLSLPRNADTESSFIRHRHPGHADVWPIRYGINVCTARTEARW